MGVDIRELNGETLLPVRFYVSFIFARPIVNYYSKLVYFILLFLPSVRSVNFMRSVASRNTVNIKECLPFIDDRLCVIR